MYIFIQRYTFYLLIFLWADSKSRITREIHDNESENISGESIGGAALMNFFVTDAALIRANTVGSTTHSVHDRIREHLSGQNSSVNKLIAGTDF